MPQREMTDNNTTLPSCIGYGRPLAPNDCQMCEYSSLCRHLAKNFVPKAKLQPIIAKIDRIQAILRGEKG
jgi:hypothetical protein